MITGAGKLKAAELIRKVLLASAAIPVAFPPVMFEVEVDGQRYDEMHADGGTSTQIFLYPMGLRWEEIAEKLAVKGTPNVYLIRNTKVAPDRKAVKPQVISIAERSISSLIRTQGIGDMYRMYLGARRDGINYHLAYIPDDFKEKEEEMFDPAFMRKLFNLGYEMAKTGYPWAKSPPGFDSP